MIPLDKQSHLLAGTTIAFTVALFLGWEFGLGAAVVAGAGKEIVDRMGFGTPDKWDFLATALGGVFAAAVYLIKEIV